MNNLPPSATHTHVTDEKQDWSVNFAKNENRENNKLSGFNREDTIEYSNKLRNDKNQHHG